MCKNSKSKSEDAAFDNIGTYENCPKTTCGNYHSRCSYALNIDNDGKQGTATLGLNGNLENEDKYQRSSKELTVALDPELTTCNPDELGSLIVVRRKDFEKYHRKKDRVSEGDGEKEYAENNTTFKTDNITPSGESQYEEIKSVIPVELPFNKATPALPPRNSEGTGLEPRDKDNIESLDLFLRGQDDFIPDKSRLLFKGLTPETTDEQFTSFLLKVCHTTPKCVERGSSAEDAIVVFETLPGKQIVLSIVQGFVVNSYKFSDLCPKNRQ